MGRDQRLHDAGWYTVPAGSSSIQVLIVGANVLIEYARNGGSHGREGVQMRRAGATMSEMIADWRLRLTARSPILTAIALIAAGNVLLGGLDVRWAAFGMIAAILWAGLWPRTAVSHQPVAVPAPQIGRVRTAPSANHFDERDWQAVLEAIPEPSLLLTADLSITAVNAAAQEMMTLRPGQHLSSGIRSPDLLAAIDRAKASGHQQSADVHFAVPVERSLSVRVSPIAAAGDRAGANMLLVVFRDRTEEQQLAQLRADFVANASHELRTPLASVKGFIETLQGPARDDPAARERFLGIMHEQASRMSRLIEDLLSLSRIEMREHVPPRDAVDLSDVAEHGRQSPGTARPRCRPEIDHGARSASGDGPGRPR